MKNRILYVVLTISLVFPVFSMSAQSGYNTVPDSVSKSINHLRYFLLRNENWFPVNLSVEKDLSSLLHYFTDDKIDTVINNLDNYLNNRPYDYLFQRLPQRVSDSLSIRGYTSQSRLNEQLLRIDRSIKSNVITSKISVPQELFADIDKKLDLIPADDADWLVRNSKITLPDSLKGFSAIPDSLMSSANFAKYQRIETARRAVLEQARIEYNNKIRQTYIDSISNLYRNDYLSFYSNSVQTQYKDSIQRRNSQLLTQYNDSVMRVVNDSIKRSVNILLSNAKQATVPVWLNTGTDSVQILMSNTARYFARMFIKNEQNDSLGVTVESIGKNSLKFLIDDGVTLNRMAERQKREVDLSLPQRLSTLEKVRQRYSIITPWTLNGKTDLGLTQIAQENWKAGGKNSLAFLFTFNGDANYTKNNVTWNNSMEIRNGWIKKGGEKIEKNNDLFRFTSRFGLKAFKKWYYSTEADFNTQFFNGYKYPNRDDVISGFFAPAYLVLKLGMDYKQKTLSILLSPISAKMTYISDTAKVNPTRYGVPAGNKSVWQSGLSADLNWSKNFGPNISYSTKYNMFVNYNSFPSSYDIKWENNINMRINTYITMGLRFYLLYDDDVLFGTGKFDGNGVEITETRWQFQEMMSLNFTYTINKKLHRRKEIKN